MTAIASGRSASDCFQSVYGKSLAQITADLHAYLHQSTVQAAVFDVKLSKPDLEPEVSDASPFSVDLALADLLASQKKTQAEATERLSKLAQDHPESADVQESLGYLAWEQGDLAKARESFKLAVRQRLEESGDAVSVLTASACIGRAGRASFDAAAIRW